MSKKVFLNLNNPKDPNWEVVNKFCFDNDLKMYMSADYPRMESLGYIELKSINKMELVAVTRTERQAIKIYVKPEVKSKEKKSKEKKSKEKK